MANLRMFFILFCIVIFTACSRKAGTSIPTLTVEERTETQVALNPALREVLDNAFSRRENISRPDEEILQSFAIEVNERRFFFRQHTHQIADTGVHRNFIRNEIEMLFRELAHSYGPYVYFGGDDVFLPVRDTIINTINMQETWFRDELIVLIYSYLSTIITDNHFRISRSALTDDIEFFHYNKPFTKSERGFSCLQSGLYVQQLILPCRPDMLLDIQDSFRFSMDESGAFFYAPVIMVQVPDYHAHQHRLSVFNLNPSILPHTIQQDTTPQYLTIVYEDGSLETVMLVQTPRKRNFEQSDTEDIKSTIEFINDIPIVKINAMGSSHDPDGIGRSEGRAFLRDANIYLQNEPVIILDLRGNRGGCYRLPIRWFYNVIGQIVPHNSFSLYHIPYDDFYWDPDNTDILPPVPLGEDHTVLDSGPIRMVPNNQLIIVLVDRFSFSAAEAMVDLAFSVENTLVVGQNTAGGWLTGSGIRRTTPFSGIHIAFSPLLNIHPEGHFTEDVGYAPDIWVMGDALTATLNMLNHHIIPK